MLAYSIQRGGATGTYIHRLAPALALIPTVVLIADVAVAVQPLEVVVPVTV